MAETMDDATAIDSEEHETDLPQHQKQGNDDSNNPTGGETADSNSLATEKKSSTCLMRQTYEELGRCRGNERYKSSKGYDTSNREIARENKRNSIWCSLGPSNREIPQVKQTKNIWMSIGSSIEDIAQVDESLDISSHGRIRSYEWYERYKSSNGHDSSIREIARNSGWSSLGSSKREIAQVDERNNIWRSRGIRSHQWYDI